MTAVVPSLLEPDPRSDMVTSEDMKSHMILNIQGPVVDFVFKMQGEPGCWAQVNQRRVQR